MSDARIGRATPVANYQSRRCNRLALDSQPRVGSTDSLHIKRRQWGVEGSRDFGACILAGASAYRPAREVKPRLERGLVLKHSLPRPVLRDTMPAMLRTFYIHTLGCRVNHYESEQFATALRAKGLTEASKPSDADLRIVHTCSVTHEAAVKSGQVSRRMTRLPVLLPAVCASSDEASVPNARARVIVTGCWATSDKTTAQALEGVDAVIGHHDDVAGELGRLLDQWQGGTPVSPDARPISDTLATVGTSRLPILGEKQTGHQRAFLKIQDGCDAHCTYCIIPSLRPTLWSKPVDDAVREARQLVASGHVELVLTGIFVGAYGQATALRRRQDTGPTTPLARLVETLCLDVPGLRRLRLSSLEPGDLTPELLRVLRSHGQVVPHFHLPLQSGSDAMLRKMNRQYTRDDFLDMIDRVQHAFDRPALTTDIIVGFPGETEEDFDRTLEVVDRAKFLHIHAFPYSSRPGTAAARWTDAFVPKAASGRRLHILEAHSATHSTSFRESFMGETVDVLVEHSSHSADRLIAGDGSTEGLRHGRCERYFDVHFEAPPLAAGTLVRVRVDRVSAGHTHGRLVEVLT